VIDQIVIQSLCAHFAFYIILFLMFSLPMIHTGATRCERSPHWRPATTTRRQA
jgi:hypothetical protein